MAGTVKPQGRVDMGNRFATVIVTAALLSGSAVFAASSNPPTAKEAMAFVAQAEEDLDRASEYLNRAAWVQATYLNYDTNWLMAKANAENTALTMRYAKDAARFENVQVDLVTRRKLYLLKQGLTLPASTKPGAAEELAEITARLDDDYSTAKLVYNGKTLTLDDMEDILRTSRDPAEMRTLWEGWRSVSSPKMKSDYVREIELANEGSRELGYADTGALWRSWYDMPPGDFATKVDHLWRQVEPLYRNNEESTMSIIRLIHVTIDPSETEKALDVWKKECAPLMIQQKGCISEKLLRCRDTHELISYSEWASEADINAYLSSEAHKEIVRHARGLKGTKATVKLYELVE